jgi:cytochrome c oxidase subunit IV
MGVELQRSRAVFMAFVCMGLVVCMFMYMCASRVLSVYAGRSKACHGPCIAVCMVVQTKCG